jgi:thiamine pyrophosphate-dependent acetolactate synthase large subunit-like protein
VLTSADACATLLARLGDELVVAANGHVSRSAFATRDRPHSFYMVGSMGLAGAIGLGLALAQPHRSVVVIDGDGNLLMGLGCLPLIAERAPPRLLHVVLDNGRYASTGGQRSIADTVDLAAVAAAAGYREARTVAGDDELKHALGELLRCAGPSLLRVRVSADGDEPRPRVPLAPPEIAERMRAAIGDAVAPSA